MKAKLQVPLSRPDITELEIQAVVDVLRGSRLSLGPKLEEFEQAVASFIGVPYAIAVSSGTAGLHLCVRALAIGPGDEVIVPSFTFVAAANAIRYEGATPVFVDIDRLTLNLDAAEVERAITPRTRAIMVVHTFGVPAAMDALMSIARRYNLAVIEDACEAIGAEYKGGRVGSFGDSAVFAFYPNKQITTGEGGVIVTRDRNLAREMRAMRNQGRYETDAWHQHSILGYNYRLSELNCALGLAQMGRLDEILRKRAQVAVSYDRLLGECRQVSLPYSGSPGEVSWFVYVVRLMDPAWRKRVIEDLAAHGIQCGRYFAPVHHQPAYSGWPLPHALPVTEAESLRTLALPFATNLSSEECAYVAERLQRSLDRLA